MSTDAVLARAARDYAAENDDDQWCQRVKYGQCALRKCNVEGGWTPGEPADYSRATCARYRLECALTTTPEPTDPAGVSEMVKLRSWARQVSIAFTAVGGGGSEMFTRIGDEFYADPDACRQRVEEKLQTARSLRTPDPVLDVVKEALAPFAKAAEHYSADHNDNPIVLPRSYAAGKDDFAPVLTGGDFRRARAALQTINERGKAHE